MEWVVVDLFQCGNIHYLLMVNCYSGYPWIHKLKFLLSKAIIKKLRSWFLEVGFPQAIRLDRGPQFWGPFEVFCSEFGIEHELCSPYNPRSNGLVEVNVRSLKYFLGQVEGQNFEDAFSSWKNFERPGKDSPNTLFFGH